MSADWFLIATQSRPSGCTHCPVHGDRTDAAAAAAAGGQLSSALAQCRSLRQLHVRTAMQRMDAGGADSTASGTMSQDDVRRSQKPYRYGMILLCFGALINWVGLAENYTEPIRYAGVACIVCGALLICTAMCCWLHSPPRNSVGAAGGPGGEDDDTEGGIIGVDGNGVHVITVPERLRTEKPPEYDTCIIHPPTYDDAVQLSPAALLAEARKMEKMPVPQGFAVQMATVPEATVISMVPSYDEVMVQQQQQQQQPPPPQQEQQQQQTTTNVFMARVATSNSTLEAPVTCSSAPVIR